MTETFVRLDRSGPQARVFVEFPWILTAGTLSLKSELRRQIRTKLSWYAVTGQTFDEGGLTAYLDEDDSRLKDLVSDIHDVLVRFSKQKITPKLVEKILKITSKERTRWTKDGRLPASGVGTFGRGNHKVRHFFHPLLDITYLVANPHIIENWRREDIGSSTS
jgi:hypothetical protein